MDRGGARQCRRSCCKGQVWAEQAGEGRIWAEKADEGRIKAEQADEGRIGAEQAGERRIGAELANATARVADVHRCAPPSPASRFS
jgi:hypothetical protein